jgi:hypothetical protein
MYLQEVANLSFYVQGEKPHSAGPYETQSSLGQTSLLHHGPLHYTTVSALSSPYPLWFMNLEIL